MRELMEAMDLVDQFERRWQQRALYYLVSTFFVVCSVWELTELAALTEQQVEAVVLDALEAVAGDGAFIAALRTEVSRAPHLNSTLREHLDDMLEHAEKGEWGTRERTALSRP